MSIPNYDIPVIKKDKERSWYDTNRNIIYSRQFIDSYNYVIEAVKYNASKCDYDRFLILSKSRIDKQSSRIEFDNFGRYKYRPITHKDYFKRFFSKDPFDFVLVEHTDNYDVYSVP